MDENVRVDGTDHTSLAMLALRTVEPHWLVILDADGVCQDVLGGSESGVGRHEARVEGIGLVGDHVLDGYTRLIKGRLGNGVVLCA